MNRKTFIQAASVLGVSPLMELPIFTMVSGKENIPIIDTHQHLWDIKSVGHGWSKPPLGGNFDQQDYIVAIHGLNIVKAVYMEVAVPENKRYEEAFYAIEVCKDRMNPTVAAVIAADPNIPEFEKYLSPFIGNQYIKGIRYFFKSEDEIRRPQVIENIRMLGKLDLSFDFSVPTKWLPAMAELAGRCPETRFLVNHCGNVDPRAFFSLEDLKGEKPDHELEEWIVDINAIAELQNVVCKISGVLTRAMNHTLTAKNLAPAINSCLDIFGPDRVMFASDWPVCLRKMELKDWVNILKEIVSNRSYVDQRKLFYDNAVQFYRI